MNGLKSELKICNIKFTQSTLNFSKDELLYEVWVNRPLAEEDEDSLLMPSYTKEIPFSFNSRKIRADARKWFRSQTAPAEDRPKDKKNPANNEWNKAFAYPIMDKKLF
jgi:hypothetical protein